jgi:anti-sigma regulatory factor (Ser/Thr protein kinase)/CheY-like chemotaxis protein
VTADGPVGTLTPQSPHLVRAIPRERAFPAQATALRHIRGFLTEHCDAAAIEHGDVDKILLAANEAATNAIEHSDCTTVRVRWEQHGDDVHITVIDDGVFHVRRHSMDHRGYGLKILIGLADEVRISAGRPRRAGPGSRGTTVQFRLHTHSVHAPSIRTASVHGDQRGNEHPRPEPHRPRLLVVDEDRFSGRSLASFLGRHGYDVTLTPSAEAGRTALAEPESRHLAIVDLTTSDGHTAPLCHEIKERLAVPVVALSVLPPGPTLPPGVDRFIAKPAHPLEVLTVVRQLLTPPTRDHAPGAPRG